MFLLLIRLIITSIAPPFLCKSIAKCQNVYQDLEQVYYVQKYRSAYRLMNPINRTLSDSNVFYNSIDFLLCILTLFLKPVTYVYRLMLILEQCVYVCVPSLLYNVQFVRFSYFMYTLLTKGFGSVCK